MSKPKSTRGGRRENQTGRPRLPDGEKRVKVAITMTREHYEATREGRSAKVEQALGLLLGENLNTQQMKQMEKQFVFGWVASNVNGNFENWSSWKDYGTREDAEKFYKETEKAAEEKGGLDWFCIEIEE